MSQSLVNFEMVSFVCPNSVFLFEKFTLAHILWIGSKFNVLSTDNQSQLIRAKKNPKVNFPVCARARKTILYGNGVHICSFVESNKRHAIVFHEK